MADLSVWVKPYKLGTPVSQWSQSVTPSTSGGGSSPQPMSTKQTPTPSAEVKTTTGSVVKKSSGSSSQPMSTKQTPTPSAEVKTTTNTVPVEVQQDIRKTTPTVTEYTNYLKENPRYTTPTYTQYNSTLKQQAVYERGVKEGTYTKSVTPFETVYTPVGEAPASSGYQGVQVDIGSIGPVPKTTGGSVQGLGVMDTGTRVESSGTSENLPRMVHSGLSEADYLSAADRMIVRASPIEQAGFNMRAALGSQSFEYTGAFIVEGLGVTRVFSMTESNPIAAMSGSLKVEQPSGTQAAVRKQLAEDIQYSLKNERPDMSFVRGVGEGIGSVPVQVMSSYVLGGGLGYGVSQLPARLTTASKVGLAATGIAATGIEGYDIGSTALAGNTNAAIGKTAGFVGSLGGGIAGFKAGYGYGVTENLASQTNVEAITSINRMRRSMKVSAEPNKDITGDVTKGIMNVQKFESNDVISGKDINSMMITGKYEKPGTVSLKGVDYSVNKGFVPKEKVLPRSDYYSVKSTGISKQVGLYGETKGGRVVFRESSTNEILYPQMSPPKETFTIYKPSRIKNTPFKMSAPEYAPKSAGAAARSNLYGNEAAMLQDKAANFAMFEGRPLQGSKVVTKTVPRMITSGGFERYAIPLPEEEFISFAPVPSSMLSQQPKMQQPTNANLAQAYTGMITFSILNDVRKEVQESIKIPQQRSISRQGLRQREEQAIGQQTGLDMRDINDVINVQSSRQTQSQMQRQITRQTTRTDITTDNPGFGFDIGFAYPRMPRLFFGGESRARPRISFGRSQPKNYTPSLTAIALGIRGSRPPSGTWGVALRPLPSRRKKSKRKKR